MDISHLEAALNSYVGMKDAAAADDGGRKGSGDGSDVDDAEVVRARRGGAEGRDGGGVLEEASPAKTDADDAPGVVVDADGGVRGGDGDGDVLDMSDLEEEASEAATLAETEADDVMEVIAMGGADRNVNGYGGVNGIGLDDLEAILQEPASPAWTETDDAPGDVKHPEAVVEGVSALQTAAGGAPGGVVVADMNGGKQDDDAEPREVVVDVNGGKAEDGGYPSRVANGIRQLKAPESEDEIEAPPSGNRGGMEDSGDHRRQDNQGNGPKDLEAGGFETYKTRDSKEKDDDEEEEEEMEVRQWKPWAVTVIVLVSAVVFVLEMYANDCPGAAPPRRCFGRFLGRMSFQPLRQNPLLGPSSSTLVKLGALKWRELVREDQVWRLVSSIWLHAGVVHLAVNMAFLVLLGVRLEQKFGFARVGLVYVLSGCGGGIASSLFASRRHATVGSSGALFGLFGSLFAELLLNWTIYSVKASSLWGLVAVVAANLAVGIFPHVGNFGNIGGFVAGLLLGFVLLMRPQRGWTKRGHATAKYNPYQYALCLTSALLLVILFTAGPVMVLMGENFAGGCSWCHYLSCVPTPLWSCRH